MNLSTLNKKYLEFYNEIFSRSSQELIKKFALKPNEFNVGPWVMLMLLDIVTETLCGFKCHVLNQEIMELQEDIEAMAADMESKIFSFTLFRTDFTVLRKRKALNSFILNGFHEVIARYENQKQSGKSESDIELLAFKYFESKPENVPLSEFFLKACLEMVAETQYTTGSALSITLVNLAVHPEYQEKVWQEQKEIFGDSLEAPSTGHLARMNYLERVIKEAIRFASPPLLGRRSTGPIETAAGVIPKNTPVLFMWDQLKTDKRYWKNGDRFDPDHFLPEEVTKRPKCAYFAFSSGPRACPGFQYAMNCIKVTISNLIRHFKLSSSLKPEDLTYSPHVMSKLDVPHNVCFKPRISFDKM